MEWVKERVVQMFFVYPNGRGRCLTPGNGRSSQPYANKCMWAAGWWVIHESKRYWSGLRLVAHEQRILIWAQTALD
ncbi:hypothetical protein CRG98_006114 [Punica granatum]|uniref:Uncharacterized protein n=1 Tax=Punica granatum TaxID=22663 RepID=A0A2I0KYV0_PUNGR|nr:hypothetical protein CRG98_006114 [Punica granatum]